MAILTRKTTVTDGDTITASMWSTELDQIITHGLACSGVEDYSADAATMKTQTDPGEVGTESLATDLAGELERLRYQVNVIQGTSYWYTNPSTSITGCLVDGLDGDKIDISITPANYTASCTDTETTGTNELSAHLRGIDNQFASGYTAGAMEDGALMLPFFLMGSSTQTPLAGTGTTYAALYTFQIGRFYLPDGSETLSGTFRLGSSGAAIETHLRFFLDTTATLSTTASAASTTGAWTEALLAGCSTTLTIPTSMYCPPPV